MENSDIDVVLYWVDGEDSDWKEKYKFHKGKSAGRFRDLGTLKYVFRSIEYNMPWIRYIHFITNGQRPAWLKDNHKLKFHTHDDIFYYPDALPIFNSSAIEANFSNIPDLSEKFILFNDDMLVLKKVDAERFFKNNLPVDFIKLSFPRKGILYNKLKPHNVDAVKFINNSYNFLEKKNVLSIGLNKIINSNYTLSLNLNNILFSFLYKVHWFDVYHHPQAHLKSTWSSFYQQDEKNNFILKNTIYSKFRSGNDVNQYLYRFMNLSNGLFYPQYFDDHISVYVNSVDTFKLNIKKYIEKTFFCICEDENLSDYEFNKIKLLLENNLEKKLPNKSTYEI
ncbi:TPA: capsular biosynthesis protein [Providencia rettgeri]|nr:capsular biosynthesis protein [Providencia rettgeri]